MFEWDWREVLTFNHIKLGKPVPYGEGFVPSCEWVISV